MTTEIEPRPLATTTAPVGGTFLVAPVVTGSVFTPERLSPEHLAIREAIGEFVAREVEPRRERLEARDYATHRELMAILGHDGYVGIEIPEAYGGAGLDQVKKGLADRRLDLREQRDGPSDHVSDQVGGGELGRWDGDDVPSVAEDGRAVA